MVHLFFFINPVEIDQVVVDMNFSMRLDKSGAVDDIDFVLEDFENLSQLFIQETNFTKPSDPSSLICFKMLIDRIPDKSDSVIVNVSFSFQIDSDHNVWDFGFTLKDSENFDEDYFSLLLHPY